MKYCPGCKNNLPEEKFGKNRSRKDGLQNKCKDCRKGYAATWYENNSETHYERVRKSRNALKKYVYEYLLSNPCVDCGEGRPQCLDFDHIDPSAKSGDITTMMKNGNRIQLLAEIEKCVVRCANCHRVRTAEQFGWYASLQSC
ncbi:HNH endonuclease [Streptomyces phage Forrest]|nr:HNH endonuclease [Streptomyces phage Forrest]QZE11475.1 HNH endonuclease [Streptomyces phage Jada]